MPGGGRFSENPYDLLFQHVFWGLIKILMLPLDSTPKNTYILRFWSTNTGECRCSGDLCVPGGGEREQTPIVSPTCCRHVNTCNYWSRHPQILIFCIVVYIGDIYSPKKIGDHWSSGWWDMVRVRCVETWVVVGVDRGLALSHLHFTHKNSPLAIFHQPDTP